MQQFVVYFEVYGKKMKTKVEATTKLDAQQQVLNQVKFNLVQEENKKDDSFDDIIKQFMEIIK
jgi:hypothetical protein